MCLCQISKDLLQNPSLSQISIFNREFSQSQLKLMILLLPHLTPSHNPPPPPPLEGVGDTWARYLSTTPNILITIPTAPEAGARDIGGGGGTVVHPEEGEGVRYYIFSPAKRLAVWGFITMNKATCLEWSLLHDNCITGEMVQLKFSCEFFYNWGVITETVKF